MKNTSMCLCLSAIDVMTTLDGEKSHCYISVFRIIIHFMVYLVPQIQDSDSELRIYIDWINEYI